MVRVGSFFFFFQAEDGIRDSSVTGVQTCALPILGVSEQPTSVSADGLASWNDAVRRAERGDTVAVIAHGEHVADVVPSGELDRLRETVAVLPDSDLVRALAEGLPDIRAAPVAPPPPLPTA